jgi:N-dimethylarginine dimethylaminohydrolase
MTTRLLMCPPRFFNVSYAINPWMSDHIGYTAPEAQRQWDRLVETLKVAGDVEIEYVEPAGGLPDLVFTANAALVSGKTALISRFKHPERQGEEPIFLEWFASHGYDASYLGEHFFEGAGDALFDRRRRVLYAGYGWRSDRAAMLALGSRLDVTVVPLELVDPRFYHLDVALCPLASGHVMAYLPAFSPESQLALRRNVGQELLIEVETDDAVAFACNAVEVDDAIVLNSASPRLKDHLANAGYRVFATELTEFLRAGGSAKCLTLKLDDGPVLPKY